MGEVRTIFIGGLPLDCTERELHLLFCEGGYEGVKLQRASRNAAPGTRPGSATAFVQFDSAERAHQAAAFVSGMVFDPTNPSGVLRVEMAKQDFKKLPVPGQGPAGGQGQGGAKRPRTGVHEARLTEKDASTLFMGGLGELVSQQELMEYASTQEGFVQVTMKDEGSPRAVAWAQFQSQEHAMAALAMLSQIMLPSLGRPANLEAARSNTGAKPVGGVPMMLMNSAPPAMAMVPARPQGGDRGGGSSTVFIGALEPQVTEIELQALLQSLQGFTRLTSKGLGQGRGTAWAQFDTHGNAANAMMALQHLMIPSMGHPANIELARNDSRSGW